MEKEIKCSSTFRVTMVTYCYKGILYKFDKDADIQKRPAIRLRKHSAMGYILRFFYAAGVFKGTLHLNIFQDANSQTFSLVWLGC